MADAGAGNHLASLRHSPQALSATMTAVADCRHYRCKVITHSKCRVWGKRSKGCTSVRV